MTTRRSEQRATTAAPTSLELVGTARLVERKAKDGSQTDIVAI